MQPLFITSGNLVADRRHDIARQYWQRGDLKAAAEVMEQALEAAPQFASAWFALGEIREAAGDRAGAIEAFRAARANDPDDRHGAGLHLMRLGEEPLAEMPRAYVRTLFDQYAPHFDRALLETLNYRGPRLLRDALLRASAASGRKTRFARAIDLGCGTGLGARAFTPLADAIVGCDLSSAMIAQAETTGLYQRLVVADMLAMLGGVAETSADLVYAVDAFVYVADLAPLFAQAARVLGADGILAFTVETHAGEGVVLGAGLRYQHSEAYLRAALARSGFVVLEIASASTRDEGGVPVPGLTAVAVSV